MADSGSSPMTFEIQANLFDNESFIEPIGIKKKKKKTKKNKKRRSQPG